MTIETEEELCQLNIRIIPRALRDEFKAFCGKRGYAMERAVVELVRQAVRDEPVLQNSRGIQYRGIEQ